MGVQSRSEFETHLRTVILGLIASAIAIPEMDRAADSRAEEILDILRNWKKK